MVDGDAIMAVLAIAMNDAGELVENTLVATVMSNLGLHIAMREAGINIVTAAVGDRYVLEELARGRIQPSVASSQAMSCCRRSAPRAMGFSPASGCSDAWLARVSRHPRWPQR